MPEIVPKIVDKLLVRRAWQMSLRHVHRVAFMLEYMYIESLCIHGYCDLSILFLLRTLIRVDGLLIALRCF